MDKSSGATDGLFRALGDPTRRALFERLAESGEQTVHALTAGTQISQPAVSKHLALLRDAGLVCGRRAGREVFYQVEADALSPLADWAKRMDRFWQSRFDRLDDLLARMDQ